MRQVMGVASRIALLVLVVGAAVGSIHLLFVAALGQRLPDWSPLAYLGAAFGIGLVVSFGEVLFYPITRFLVDADEVSDPLWLRLLRALALVFLGFAIVLVIAWVNLRYGAA